MLLDRFAESSRVDKSVVLTSLLLREQCVLCFDAQCDPGRSADPCLDTHIGFLHDLPRYNLDGPGLLRRAGLRSLVAQLPQRSRT